MHDDSNSSDGAMGLPKRAVEIRTARRADIPHIIELVEKCYPAMSPYTPAQLRGQQSAFPAGQLVVLYDGEVVGFAATFIVAERLALRQHSWSSITGGGYAAQHDPQGEWLYGMEVCVAPDRRRLRIGQRLYEARKALCEEFELKGIIFAGRMPGYADNRHKYPNPDDYLKAVQSKEIEDPVISFHLRADFQPIKILRHYHPADEASAGNAVLYIWQNPFYEDDASKTKKNQFRLEPETARITTVQLQARPVESRDAFYKAVENFVDAASDYRSDFVVFPELFTLQMLAAEHKDASPADAIDQLTKYTSEFVTRINEMAISYNINIIGGSHPTRLDDGDIHNVCYVFLRDGSVHAREKLHPTPDERYWWNIEGGEQVEPIDTDCGPIGIMICYDSEFPEIARRLVDQGAMILFVPFCTDTRQAYLRVRFCCQARAIENQCYVVAAGNVGNLPYVRNMDLQYAQSAVFTPCDYPFARDGLAAEASENVEMVIVADLDLAKLRWARSQGSVRNLRDRRFDLYRTIWTEDGAKQKRSL